MTENLTQNLITVGVEVLAVVVLFVVLIFLLKRVVLGLGSLGKSQTAEKTAAALWRKLRFLLQLLAVVCALAVVAGNAWLLIQQGERDLRGYTLDKVRSVPSEFWWGLAFGAAKVLGLLILAWWLLRWVRRALDAACRKAQHMDSIRANDESIAQFFASLTTLIQRATWLAVLAFSATLLHLPQGVHDGLMVLLRIFVIVGIGTLVWRALDAIIDSLDGLSQKYATDSNWLRWYKKLTHLVPLFRRMVELAIYVVVGSLVVLQISAIADLAGWGPRLLKVLGVVFLSRVAVEVANLLVDEMLVGKASLSDDQRQRRMTLVPLLKSALKYAIYFTAGIVIFKQLGIDPTPALAGAGILTLVVGLGAQNMINDIVSGFFILFENYYLVGDFIKAGDIEGEVEAIDLRATRIRDENGRLHIIRNGQIDNVTNYSKVYTMAVVEVGVAYESDLDHVFTALETVGPKVAAQCDDVLQPLAVDGLENFGESELLVRTETKVKPGKHRDVERLTRKAIKEAFDQFGVEIPYARRVVLMKSLEEDEQPSESPP